jgi:hypothetical protein
LESVLFFILFSMDSLGMKKLWFYNSYQKQDWPCHSTCSHQIRTIFPIKIEQVLVLYEICFVQRVLFDIGRRRTRLDIGKKERKHSQVKVIWITPFFLCQRSDIFGNGAPFLFNFHSRVPMCFHVLFLDLERKE